MARLNKFASVNFNDSYGKADQSHGGASSGSKSNSASSTKSRISSHSGGMLILTRPKQLPSSSGKLGIPNPVNLPSLKREGTETLAVSPPVPGWSMKGGNSDVSSANPSLTPNTNHIFNINHNPDTITSVNPRTDPNSSLNSKRIGDAVPEQVKPLLKPDVYAPPAVRAIMKNASGSIPLISPPLEKQHLVASKFIREEEFPALQAPRPPTPPGPHTKAHIEKNQKQKQNSNKDNKDGVDQLPYQKPMERKHQDRNEEKSLQPPLPSLPLQNPSGTQELVNKREDDSEKELDLCTSLFGHQSNKRIISTVDEEASILPANGRSEEPKEVVVHSFRPQYRARVSAPPAINTDVITSALPSLQDSLPKGNSESLKLLDNYRPLPFSKGTELRSGSFGKGNSLDKDPALSRDVGLGGESPQNEGSEHTSEIFGKDITDSSLFRDVGFRGEVGVKDIKDSMFSRGAGLGGEGALKEEVENRSDSSWKDTKDFSFSRDVGVQRKSPPSERPEHRIGSFGKDTKNSSFSRANDFTRKNSLSEGYEHKSGASGKDIKESLFSKDVGLRRKSLLSEGPDHRIKFFGKGSYLNKDLKDTMPNERLEHGNGSSGRVIKDSSFSIDAGFQREYPSSGWPEHRNESFGKKRNFNKDLKDDGYRREGLRSRGPQQKSSLNKNPSLSRDVANGRDGAYVEHDDNIEDSFGRRSFGRISITTQSSPGFYGQTSFSSGMHNEHRREVNDWGIKYTQDRDSTGISRKERSDAEESTASVHRKGGRGMEEYNPGMNRKDRRDVEQYSARDFRENYNRNAVDVYDQHTRSDQLKMQANLPIKDGGQTDSRYNRDGSFYTSRPYSPGEVHDAPYIRRYNSYGSGEHAFPKDRNSVGRWSPSIESEGLRSNPHSEPAESWKGRGISHDSVRENGLHTGKVPNVLEQDQLVMFEDKGRHDKAKASTDEPHGSYYDNDRSFHKGQASQRISGRPVRIDVNNKLNDEQSASVDVRTQVVQEEERRKEAARLKLLELEERIAQRPSEVGRKEGELNGVADNRSHMMNIEDPSGQEDVISIKPFPYELKEPLLYNERTVIPKEEQNLPLRVTERPLDQDHKIMRSRSPPTSSWRKETGSGPRSKLFSSPYIESGGFRRPTADGGTYKLF